MARVGIAQRLPAYWYMRPPAPALWPLLPLSGLYALLTAVRRQLYRCGALPSYRLPVPVIVVGNLTAGGSGKTPLVLWLVQQFVQRGWRPGIISRGYGRTSKHVQQVKADSQWTLVGDEPLLMVRRSGVPVFVGHDRASAGRALLAAYPECNVIISDDGLQHYRLQRTAEVVVFDARGAGNGWLLPAGPLREPFRRLASSTAVVWNGPADERRACAASRLPQFAMRLVSGDFIAVNGEARRCEAEFLRRRKLYAVAGIGNPSRFFQQIRSLGLQCEEHPFADHHPYVAADLAFAQDGALLMTEKDAVKCSALVAGEAWALPVEAVIDGSSDSVGLFETLMEKIHGHTPA